MEEQDPSFC